MGPLRNASATALFAMLVVHAGAATAGPIEELEPGHWYEVPDSHLAPHMPPATGEDWSGASGIMAAWSGGAYDSTRDRLVIWGGGHHDYAGNEIYVFDVATLGWSRLNDRSADVGGDEASGYYPDGTPRARHTYEYIEYVPAIDRFCSFGGSALFPSGQIGIANVDCFDFDALTWERKADTPSASIGAVAAVDPKTGHVWMQGAGNGLPLAEYDPQGNGWTSHVKEPSGWFGYGHTADIDASRDKLVALGGGEVVVWDLGQPATDPVRLQTTGATAIEQAGNPGVAYDPVSDRIVAWSGGAEVYTLNLDTSAWEVHPPAATNTVIPTAAATNGTYGRFRYVASRNVFIVVNAIDESVYFYKLSPGSGVIPDAGVDDTGAAGAGGSGEADAGAADGSGGTQAADSGTGGSGGQSTTDGGGAAKAAPGSSDDEGGCGCRTTRQSGTWPGVIAFLLALGLFARRSSD